MSLKPSFSFLFDTEKDVFGYIIKTTILAIFSSILVSALLSLTVGLASGEVTKLMGWLNVFGAVVFAPLVENFVLVCVLEICSKFTKNMWIKAVTGALFFALLHSSSRWSWGLTVFFSFVIFSLSYLVWQKEGRLKAFFISVAIHSLNNTFAVVMVYLVVTLQDYTWFGW